MGTWKAANRTEVEAVIDEQLAGCTESQRQLYESLRTELTEVPIERSGDIESVFAVAKHGRRMLFWEDIHGSLEWAIPDADGVLRDYASSELELTDVLYKLEDG